MPAEKKIQWSLPPGEYDWLVDKSDASAATFTTEQVQEIMRVLKEAAESGKPVILKVTIDPSTWRGWHGTNPKE